MVERLKTFCKMAKNSQEFARRVFLWISTYVVLQFRKLYCMKERKQEKDLIFKHPLPGEIQIWLIFFYLRRSYILVEHRNYISKNCSHTIKCTGTTKNTKISGGLKITSDRLAKLLSAVQM